MINPPQSSAEKAYLTRLQNIPIDLSIKDYFAKLKSTLGEGYEPVKESMQFLRKKIIEYINEYNTNKKLENELKIKFQRSNSFETSPSL